MADALLPDSAVAAPAAAMEAEAASFFFLATMEALLPPPVEETAPGTVAGAVRCCWVLASFRAMTSSLLPVVRPALARSLAATSASSRSSRLLVLELVVAVAVSCFLETLPARAFSLAAMSASIRFRRLTAVKLLPIEETWDCEALEDKTEGFRLVTEAEIVVTLGALPLALAATSSSNRSSLVAFLLLLLLLLLLSSLAELVGRTGAGRLCWCLVLRRPRDLAMASDMSRAVASAAEEAPLVLAEAPLPPVELGGGGFR
mmetsp:Transcript_21867/g.60762  ORF Transcript_21867/g.60762 Transcript_21867/m.60762 type:complete len:260 (+) Transcript_21867:1993-2772(+)